MNKKLFKNKGFTLLETLVAIMLFVIALSALLALVRDSVTAATYTKNEVVATYLAQEGVDYIRNLRDETVHVSPSTSAWNDFTTTLDMAGCSTSGCSLDLYGTGSPLSPCTGLCPILRLASPDPVYSLPERYTATGNLPGTLFRRKITAITNVTGVALIKVEVTWYNGLTARSRVLVTTLYDWAL